MRILLIKWRTPKAYVEAGNYQDNMPVIQIVTYCILPGNVPVTVEYSLDGKKGYF